MVISMAIKSETKSLLKFALLICILAPNVYGQFDEVEAPEATDNREFAIKLSSRYLDLKDLFSLRITAKEFKDLFNDIHVRHDASPEVMGLMKHNRMEVLLKGASQFIAINAFPNLIELKVKYRI